MLEPRTDRAATVVASTNQLRVSPRLASHWLMLRVPSPANTSLAEAVLLLTSITRGLLVSGPAIRSGQATGDSPAGRHTTSTRGLPLRTVLATGWVGSWRHSRQHTLNPSATKQLNPSATCSLASLMPQGQAPCLYGLIVHKPSDSQQQATTTTVTPPLVR